MNLLVILEQNQSYQRLPVGRKRREKGEGIELVKEVQS